MLCPRCRGMWDKGQNACGRCGLTVGPKRQFSTITHLKHASAPSVSTSESEKMQEKPLKVTLFPDEAPRTQPLHPQRMSPRAGNTDQASRHVPQTSPPLGMKDQQVTDALQWDGQVPQPPLWVKRLASNAPFTASPLRPANRIFPSEKAMHNAHSVNKAQTTHATNRPSMTPKRSDTQFSEPATRTRSLKPGTLLLNGRYRLYECQDQQTWLSGAFEASWLAQDAQRGGAMVRICEFVLPDKDAIVRQSILRTATMALHAISRHAHVPTLLDVFNDHERSFFVFEYVEGESLLARMRRTGRVFTEPEVVECCLQITNILEFLVQQSPPLVHGLIRPENIVVGRNNSQYVLLNFSVMLSGGATQFVAGVPRIHLSPYTAPEFARGTIDARSDSYALMSTAYFLLTSSEPVKRNGGIVPVRQLNSSITPQFEAILAKGLSSGKGLRPDMTQRFQHPSELRQALLTMNIVSGTLAPEHGRTQGKEKDRSKPASQAVSPAADTLVENHPILQKLVSDIAIDEPKLLLPRPEDLPPMDKGNDLQKAVLCLVSLLLCLVLVIVMGRGLV